MNRVQYRQQQRSHGDRASSKYTYAGSCKFAEGVNDMSGIWMQPIRAVINGKDKTLGAMTRSVVIGTQWTQHRVEAAGYADQVQALLPSNRHT